jgi:Tfp pilus assembly protein PilV
MRQTSDDRGAALIEVLIAVVVLSTAGLAILGGMYTSIAVSDVHRKQATVGALAQDYAERVAGETYVECASASAYTLTAGAVTVPAGYSVSVDSVEYWTGSGWSAACASAGLQRVTVVASSDDGRATEHAVVVVRHR